MKKDNRPMLIYCILYTILLVIFYIINRHLYFGFLFFVMFCQSISFLCSKWFDRKTQYRDSKIVEEPGRIKVYYSYLAFPVVLLFMNHFRELRKDSYYQRKYDELSELKNYITFDDELKERWEECFNYLRIKKLQKIQKKCSKKVI